MAAFKNGERTGGRAPVMIAMAKVLTDADVKAAAEYYAALKPRIGYNKVIETETHGPAVVALPGPRKPMTGTFPGCCARAVSGQAAAPPSSAMKSRRFQRWKCMRLP